jgi:lipid II:glycine glycyltransferase (peptidoglycan interpeptide bridge formation enzyme)
LDLCRSREDILRGYHKQCIHRKIARSEREQLRYEEGRSEDLLAKFYSLLLLTRRRHQLPPQPLLWFRNLIDCLGESLKIRVASKDGAPVASIITLSFKNVVTYKYGCSDPRFNALGGSVMLMWRTIQDAMDEGAAELDLGRSDHDTPGLITFKDHWGAERSRIDYYRYPAAVTRVFTNGVLVGMTRRLVTAIPDSLFTALGGLLYRHVG